MSVQTCCMPNEVHSWRSHNTCLCSPVHAVVLMMWEKRRCVHLQIGVLCTAVGHMTLVYVPCSCFGAHDMRRKRCMRLQIGALCTAVGYMTLVTYVPLFMLWWSWCEKKKVHVSADWCVVHDDSGARTEEAEDVARGVAKEEESWYPWDDNNNTDHEH